MSNNLYNQLNNQITNTLFQSNPQLQQVMNMVKSSNMSPKDLFYQQCQQRGVDPNSILNQLK